jgi:choline kinase
MKYIIMADGKGTRWNNFNNIPKHFIEIDGEKIIFRTVRLLNEMDPACSVTVTSHDPRYDIPGSVRHEPSDNILEIDRFTEELIENNVCFLYGDTYYSEEALSTIIRTDANPLMFFGNSRSIIAVKIKDADVFKKHFSRIKALFLAGKISRCVGWQIYESFTGGDLESKQINGSFVRIDDSSRDFNSPADYINK